MNPTPEIPPRTPAENGSAKNYLGYSVSLTALLIVCLLLLHIIPEFDVGPFHFKRINMLADIMNKEPKPKDLAKAKPPKPVYVDSCKTGVTCVEDYSKDKSGMTAFFSALDSVAHRPVRIAWFADSYVEGDIMLDPLRDTLQALFGGSGVGFVPITSEVAGFRQTVIHSFEHWKTYAIVGEKDDDHPIGPGGYTAVPTSESSVTYRSIKRPRLNIFPSVKIFYGNADSAALLLDETQYLPLKSGKRLHMEILDGTRASLQLSAPRYKQLDLYGVSFEAKTGISVDNFSMRGNSGIGLSFVPEQLYRDFDSLHHYDLVVMAYGLNVASQKAKNYTWYVRGMQKTIAMIKRAFPHSSILLVGCSDRAANVDGDMQTMPMLKELIDVQQQMAMDNQICFWNLFEAMGGDSTMIRWTDMKKHAFADKDFTHLTFYGGNKVASIFLETILTEKEKYERRKRSL